MAGRPKGRSARRRIRGFHPPQERGGPEAAGRGRSWDGGKGRGRGERARFAAPVASDASRACGASRCSAPCWGSFPLCGVPALQLRGAAPAVVGSLVCPTTGVRAGGERSRLKPC